MSLFYAYNNINTKNSPDNHDKYLKTKLIEPIPSDDNESTENPGSINSPASLYGMTSFVPWENSSEFNNARKINNTNILMCAYKISLKEPLPDEKYNVDLAAKLVAGTVVNPGQIFSQNQSIGPYLKSKGFKEGRSYVGSRVTTTVGGGVCKVASALYNAAVLSNLEIIERHPHSMPVPYAPYGQDASVVYGVKDFKFKNNQSFPILIWVQLEKNTLYVGLYGNSKPPEIKWHHKILEKRKAPKLYRKNSSLPKGAMKIVIEGIDGATVESWVTIENPDGTKTIKSYGRSYYKPMPYIIEIGE